MLHVGCINSTAGTVSCGNHKAAGHARHAAGEGIGIPCRRKIEGIAALNDQVTAAGNHIVERDVSTGITERNVRRVFCAAERNDARAEHVIRRNRSGRRCVQG